MAEEKLMTEDDVVVIKNLIKECSESYYTKADSVSDKEWLKNVLLQKIKGITDREYYTNSFHIPVYYNISIANKIKKEGPYHALTNAGHISYIELDGDPTQNVKAFQKIVRMMKENNMGYAAINHPVDRDPVCGYVGIIGDVCPGCGRREGEGVSIKKIQSMSCDCK